MNRAEASSGGGRTEAGNRSATEIDWRAILRRHAERVWRKGAQAPAANETELLERALGPLAEDALRLVEAYALGGARVAGAEAPPADFGSRLVIIFNGIEAAIGDASTGATKAQAPHVIQSELWKILRKVRESGDLSYSREYPLIELDRRILFLLQRAGPLVPADISGSVGVDKAQVSRSVKRLLELGLVDREQIRSPLRLTPKAEAISKRMLRLAEMRNRELTIDISEGELKDFYDMTEVLLERAMALYEQERALAQSQGLPDEPAESGSEGKTPEKIVIDRTRIVSPLLTLSAYFSRSGALAFKRKTGLSSFEAFVLSEIGIDPPVEWSALVAVLARDHSQAGRTIQALIERGLVAREGKPGRRHGRFYPTAEGARLHKVIHDAGKQRSDFLLAPLSADQRARFLGTFDKIHRNARAQLERERAYEELGRG